MLLDYSTPSLPIFMTITPGEISDMLCPPCYANPCIVVLRVMKMLMMRGDYPLILSVMRAITGKNGNGKQAASVNTMGRFETEIMTQRAERESQQSVRYQWQVGKLKL